MLLPIGIGLVNPTVMFCCAQYRKREKQKKTRVKNLMNVTEIRCVYFIVFFLICYTQSFCACQVLCSIRTRS